MNREEKRYAKFRRQSSPKEGKKKNWINQKNFNFFYTILLWILIIGGSYYVWLMPNAKSYVHIFGYIMLGWAVIMMGSRAIRFYKMNKAEGKKRIDADIEREKQEKSAPYEIEGKKDGHD